MNQQCKITRLIARQHIRNGDFDKAIFSSKKIPYSFWDQLVTSLQSNGDFEETFRIFNNAFFSSNRNDYSDIPQWSDSKVLVDLFEETVLLTQWDKGGGGDEFLFAEVILNLKSLGHNLYIEAEPRSYELYRNSFPDNIVFNANTIPPWEQDKNLKKPTIQLHTRCYAFHLYNSIKCFPRPNKYFQANSKLQEKWKNTIDSVSKNKLKVGFNWRSYWFVGETFYECLSIRDLKLMFSEIKDEISLFNLQYDITEQEKEFISDKLDLDVYYPEIDQMQDFHNLAAFISELDVVICPPTTTYSLAGAVGTKIIFLRPSSFEEHCYVSLGWFKKELTVIKDHCASWETILPISSKQINF